MRFKCFQSKGKLKPKGYLKYFGFFSIILAGCVTPGQNVKVLESNSSLIVIEYTKWYGSELPAATSKANTHCQKYEKNAQIVEQGPGANHLDRIRIAFKCNETAYQAAIQAERRRVAQNEIREQENKKLQAEVARQQELEKVKQEPIQAEAVKKNATPESERLSLEASKKKCTELGFKPATELHGKCVLQLSK